MNKENSYSNKIPQEEYADISLLTLSRVIRSYKYLIASVFLTSVFISGLVATFSQPIYSSSIVVVPVSGETAMSAGLGGALARMAGFGIGRTAERNSRAVSLSAIESPYFTMAFIDENNLRPILFDHLWDKENKEWQVSNPDDIPTLTEAYDLFSNEVLQVEEMDTNLVTITIMWKDPVIAAQWADLLIANTNERLRTQSIEDANLTIAYLNEELGKTNAVELQKSLYMLVEQQIQKKTMAKVQKEFAFKVLSPAVVADIDKYVSPNRPFIISIGFLLGLFGGIFIAILMEPIKTIIKDTRNSKK